MKSRILLLLDIVEVAAVRFSAELKASAEMDVFMMPDWRACVQHLQDIAAERA